MIPLASIARARETLAGSAVRTPLVRLRLDDAPAEIWLKLECLQPIGSFKIRGALNAMAEAPPGALAAGVVTASAGNMAQGVAWGARERGIPCTVVVPETAPQTKIDAIERLGGSVAARALRGLVERDHDLRAPRRRGLLRASGARRRRDGRQRHDRPRDPRGPARRRRRARPVGRRRPDLRHRQRAASGQAGHEGDRGGARHGRAPDRLAARAASRSRSTSRPRSSTARAAARCCRRCGVSRRSWWTAPSP